MLTTSTRSNIRQAIEWTQLETQERHVPGRDSLTSVLEELLGAPVVVPSLVEKLKNVLARSKVEGNNEPDLNWLFRVAQEALDEIKVPVQGTTRRP